MRLERAEDYLRAAAPGRKPVALMICEDDYLVDETADRLLEQGFAHVAAAGPGAAALTQAGASDRIYSFPAETRTAEDKTRLINRLIQGNAGRWMLVCFNGEFFFYPFSETRSISDLTEFLESERRAALMTYGIDLYSDAMRLDAANAARGGAPTAQDINDLYFDREGWYGFAESDKTVEVFGGLGWRFEEYTPRGFARINRPALFRAGEDVRVDETLWLSDETMNAISCPWHHNPTGALMSTRRTRMLLRHPSFPREDASLVWTHSARFEWRSDQLVAAGLIEAGQWF